MKKRILIGTGALLLAASPAVIGLWGNPSFAESVPVPVPSMAQVLAPTPTPTPSASVDDHGGDVPRDQRVEPGDDRGDGSRGSDDGAGVTPSDDAGGDAPRDARVEPGDDRTVQGGVDTTQPTDDGGTADDRRADDGGNGGRGGDSGHGGGHGGDD